MQLGMVSAMALFDSPLFSADCTINTADLIFREGQVSDAVGIDAI